MPLQGSRQVLTDALIARLATVGRQVKQALGGADQDIEWAVVGDELIILQSRPRGRLGPQMNMARTA